MRPHVSLLLLLLAAPLAQAANETYRLDPVHTRVMFAIEHAGFSQALGTVSGSQGTLAFDLEDWAAAHLVVEVPIARLDLGDAEWNKATLARGLLDGTRFPSARFVSTHVEPIDARHAKVTGQLTLRGVSREVVLDVTLNALKRHPLPPFRRTAGFSATTTLSRSAFGMTSWPSVIGDAVQIRIEAEATLDRSATPGTPDADAHSDTPTATKDPA
ncbi:YceI family protein [Stenotrophomonas sp. 24(2023)]|uniref:YceI family protein n=1 Tax=Stenotrophomonas sp. 24(2023) TaxID=3068324 RepID=UPI0027E07195|nr:YceI family protein [Stenotrophomonas sp. 24(2023)]WMJ71405.1 YceI family protein [Stenotrophomonas sp. 24(2023)]